MPDEKAKNRKPLTQRIAARIRLALARADDRRVQRKMGAHKDHRAALLERMKALPGGAALLVSAKKHDVKIFVVRPKRIKGSAGRFSRAGGKPVVRIANSGDRPRMAATLWHELRHVQQHIDRGDIRTGGVSRLFGVRREHVISLMIEADAFTAQAVMALREKKAGNAEYHDAFMSRTSAAVACICGFVKRNPYDSFADEAQFSRALFTELMLTGLQGYNGKYMRAYHDIFKARKTADAFRAALGKRKPPPPFRPSDAITSLYGAAAQDVSVDALADAFLETLPKTARATLDLIDKTVAGAPGMTDAAFRKARTEILRRTKTLSKAFGESAVKKPPLAPARDVAERLRANALGWQPPRKP